ncbi:MAG TPA: thiamine phosphate synthase [Rhizomicrobium sp.]|nr:thiamine phosphate synthase [Rhizomicrobium sp.]
MATKLAKQQRRLNAALPLVLMTDDRAADWARAVRALPRGSIVVVRARDAKRRAALAQSLRGLARLLIADDPALAARLAPHVAGLHLPEARMKQAPHWRARRPRWIITASAHSLRALKDAAWLDAVFLSPVFPTQSHPGAPALTPVRAGLIAARAPVPVYALGGVTAQSAARLAPAFSGIAAIGGLLQGHRGCPPHPSTGSG